MGSADLHAQLSPGTHKTSSDAIGNPTAIEDKIVLYLSPCPTDYKIRG